MEPPPVVIKNKFGSDESAKERKKFTFQDFLKTKGGKTMATFAQRPNLDYFHREILMDVDVESSDEEVDKYIDIELVDSKAPSTENVESTLFLEQARNTSDQLCTMLPRPLKAEGACDILDALNNSSWESPNCRAIIIYSVGVLIEFLQEQLPLEYTTGSTVKLHNDAIRKCYQLRDVFCSHGPEIETMTWAHGYLLRNLPNDYLTCYLVLLRYWRYQLLSLVDSFSKRAFLQDSHPWPQVTKILWGYVGLDVIDPDQEILQETIDPEALSDVIFVLVPPSLQYGEYSFSTKAHEVLYRWLKAMGSKESYTVNMDYKEKQGDVWAMNNFFVKKIKDKVDKLVNEHKNKRIVLVGWRLTSYYAHRVVSLTNGVSAIIDLAFPLKSNLYRGLPDDNILLNYCPSLFIVGSGADTFNAIALNELKVNMISESGSLIIHRADNHLYVPTDILNLYGITMGTVYRGILEHIVEFLKLPSTKRNRSQLTRGNLNSIYDVELFALEHLAAAEIQPQQITQQRATTDGRFNASRQLKRKTKMAEFPAKTEYRSYEVFQTAQIANAISLPSLLTPKEEPE